MARARFVRSSTRPNRGWSYVQTATSTTVPAASKVLLGSFTNATGVDLTILRVIGGLSVASDQTAAIEEQLGAFGMIVVTDIALAAGIASIPGPVTDGGDDGWFVHRDFQMTSQLVNTSPMSEYFAVESKGKRVVGSGVIIAIVAENAHASQGLALNFAIRMLSQVRGTR